MSHLSERKYKLHWARWNIWVLGQFIPDSPQCNIRNLVLDLSTSVQTKCSHLIQSKAYQTNNTFIWSLGIKTCITTIYVSLSHGWKKAGKVHYMGTTERFSSSNSRREQLPAKNSHTLVTFSMKEENKNMWVITLLYRNMSTLFFQITANVLFPF